MEMESRPLAQHQVRSGEMAMVEWKGRKMWRENGGQGRMDGDMKKGRRKGEGKEEGRGEGGRERGGRDRGKRVGEGQ